MNFYKRFIGDYRKKTARLSPLDHGVYTLLLDEYYATEEPLPVDSDELFAIVGARSAADRASIKKILDRYWKKTSEGWTNERAVEEIAEFRDKSGKAKAAAHKRWQSENDADAMQTHMRTHDERICEGTSNARSRNSHSQSQTPEGELVVRPLGGASCSPLPEVEQTPITDSGEDEIWKRRLPK